MRIYYLGNFVSQCNRIKYIKVKTLNKMNIGSTPRVWAGGEALAFFKSLHWRPSATLKTLLLRIPVNHILSSKKEGPQNTFHLSYHHHCAISVHKYETYVLPVLFPLRKGTDEIHHSLRARDWWSQFSKTSTAKLGSEPPIRWLFSWALPWIGNLAY